jgi:hypothetical protein
MGITVIGHLIIFVTIKTGASACIDLFYMSGNRHNFSINLFFGISQVLSSVLRVHETLLDKWMVEKY